jgi:hypothetical protein
MQESMCEVATHSTWAQHIIEQARLYGIRHPNGNIEAADGNAPSATASATPCIGDVKLYAKKHTHDQGMP